MSDNHVAGSPETVIRATHLKKYYTMSSEGFGRPRRILRAVDDVSLQIDRGRILGVVGESGCGKSTLGRSLLRLFPVTDGEIFFAGQDISRLTRRELKPIRRNMQMVFQNPYASFNPKQRIGKALREVGHVYGMNREESMERIRGLLETIRLPDTVLERLPSELSGGQLQRLAFARALMTDPDFIVADEPVSALDVSVQAQILNLIVDLRRQMGLTMLFISHEMTVVEHICDEVAVMYLGEIVEQAPTQELFANLLHPYTQALMSAVPRSDPEEKKERILLEGDVQGAVNLPPGCRFASRCRFCQERCRQEHPGLREVRPGHFAACHFAENGAGV